LASQPALDLRPCQQEQVIPERLQPTSQLFAIVRHGFHPLKSLNDRDPEIERDRETIEKPLPGQAVPVGRRSRSDCCKYTLSPTSFLVFEATRLDE
jgi:hypothetical protein